LGSSSIGISKVNNGIILLTLLGLPLFFVVITLVNDAHITKVCYVKSSKYLSRH